MDDFELCEALLCALTEENVRLRETASALGAVAERLNSEIRALREAGTPPVADDDTGGDSSHAPPRR